MFSRIIPNGSEINSVALQTLWGEFQHIQPLLVGINLLSQLWAPLFSVKVHVLKYLVTSFQ